MSPETLVSYASKRGIVFKLDSGRLKAVASRELTERERRVLREHREMILEYLRRDARPAIEAAPEDVFGNDAELMEWMRENG